MIVLNQIYFPNVRFPIQNQSIINHQFDCFTFHFGRISFLMINTNIGNNAMASKSLKQYSSFWDLVSHTMCQSTVTHSKKMQKQTSSGRQSWLWVSKTPNKISKQFYRGKWSLSSELSVSLLCVQYYLCSLVTTKHFDLSLDRLEGIPNLKVFWGDGL